MTKWITDENNRMLFLFEDEDIKYVVDLKDGAIVLKDKDEYKLLLTEMQKLWINFHKQNEQTGQPA